ncbi:MAG: diphthamide biosynthesis enzyme Dph2 [Candidatus Methanomethylophilaceae archaeon]|jgi:2-(3-amino-3-carboxypropyl)histidine synthase|nr:diphthamide biosynthesis enzyme Dph2 [Candidatus Methanomethylophilaceae archaeon]NLF33664.1 diphthamide biosynthesis enzyme Dph2 [Thermoplasmatales archaeon]
MFDLEIENITAWIRDRGYPSVALQLPEGLKVRATGIAEEIRRATGADVFILGQPCYGACDLFTDYKKVAGALVHFGHSPIPSMGADPDVLYVPAFDSPDISSALSEAAPSLPGRIGLLASVQYVGLIPRAKEILESFGKTALAAVGDSRVVYPGQVLGCNCSSAEAVADRVDAFLFIGEGDFHPLAAAFGVDKELRVLNPVTGEMRSVEGVRDRILRRRFAAIESAKDAGSFLVIVCSKAGQDRSPEAERITSIIRSSGRSAHKILLDEITPERLQPYAVDAYVNTACPRIAMDDSVRYARPMLTLTETEIVLGLRSWDEYEFDAIRP